MAFILDDILLAPCKFVCWIGQTVRDRAVAEFTNEAAIHERLLNLQTQLEMGEIAEEDYIRQETALMRRLNEIHEYKEAQRRA